MIDFVLRPALGVVLLCCAVGALRQPGRAFSAVAFVCAAVAIGLWPPPILLELDRSTGHPGFGYMLTRSLIDTGILLHVVDVTRATRYWDHFCTVLLTVAIGALTGFIAAWLWTQGMGIPAARAEHLYYDSFPGRPDAMFALSIMVGVQSAASAVFAAYVVGRQTVIDRAAKRTRIVVFGFVMVFLWAYDVSWSLLGPIEGTIERYGQPVSFIVWYVRYRYFGSSAR